jgi:hypothetical protein
MKISCCVHIVLYQSSEILFCFVISIEIRVSMKLGAQSDKLQAECTDVIGKQTHSLAKIFCLWSDWSHSLWIVVPRSVFWSRVVYTLHKCCSEVSEMRDVFIKLELK